MSYLLVLLVVRYAHSLKLLDVPNERSHHCSIIASGAGIGFVSAIFMAMLFFNLQLSLEYWFVFVAILMVFGIGVLDDRHDVSPKMKFVFIFAAVILMWINGVSFDTLGRLFGYELSLYWLALPFSLLAMAGLTNALNLVDGLDGLAGSLSIIILASFAYVGHENGNAFIYMLSTYSMASVVGFMFLNWNPAKVFMGDSGSLTLGFIVSVLAVMSTEYVQPVTLLYFIAIPILDTLIVMLRRIRRKASPFSADKTHLHHILVKFFDNNVKKTVIFLSLLQILFSSIGYILAVQISDNPDGFLPLFALFIFAIIFVVFYMIFTGIKKRQNTIDHVDE